MQATLDIFKKYFPPHLFTKLSKYVTLDCGKVRINLNWNSFREKLDPLDLDACAHELIGLLENQSISENNVKTFHISTNKEINRCTEPTAKTTTAMVYRFLMYIYQRNIIASLVKYVLLKKLLLQFSTSSLTITHKGVFSSMQRRLNEIIFECVLTAFNGSNYDNYLISNSLIIILTNINEKILLFKKGASISTIKIIVKENLTRFHNILNTRKQKTKKDTANKWIMNLYIKDIRELVASNLSLDKVGKLFNLPVSKLCFPYNKATSIKALKTFSSLHPHDELFWRDTFTGKEIPLAARLEAQAIFNSHNFCNLYQYSDYYLKLDCVLLHSIVITLFTNYLADGINIFLRRKYSQSNLAYEQFFIVEPSRQIDQVLAPKKISNTFFNYVIKQAVTGGLCTSFVHGTIDKNTIINEHLNYVGDPQLHEKTWPNFHHMKHWSKVPTHPPSIVTAGLSPEQSDDTTMIHDHLQDSDAKDPCEKPFTNTPSGIVTIDIRSLYPSATVKKMPVNSPLFYTRCVHHDFSELQTQSKYSSIHVKSFCDNVRKYGNYITDKFKLINDPPRFYNEFHALNHYLASLPDNVSIVRFQSSFTAMGQLYLCEYPVDGFLAFRIPNSNTTFLKIIQYQSVYRHGHLTSCFIKNDERQQELANATSEIKSRIGTLLQHLQDHFQLGSCIDWEYVEISDCTYNHKLTKCGEKEFLFSYRKGYTYHGFLHDILRKKLTGLIVVKNLEIKKDNQSPLFGFIIQKAQYNFKNLSPYTQERLSKFHDGPKVVSLHKNSGFMVISTDYFVQLHNMFGFEKTPDIYHALLFQQASYLRHPIESKLETRRLLKNQIKAETDPEKRLVYEIKAELIKLMLNSCYGFTLCNLTSSKFKTFKNLKTIPEHKKRREKLKSCVQLSPGVFLGEYEKSQIQSPFESMLGHVGCTILFFSKIILLKRLYFLLHFLDPTEAQLLYMDTDSAHFLVKHRKFEDNVDPQLREEFLSLYDKHFETGQKVSGIWVEEGFFTSGQYIGEKSYVLSSGDKTLSHMKGLNNMFQAKFVSENINLEEQTCISYNNMQKSSDFAIYKTYMSKDLFKNYIPIKRYFVCATGSLPLKIP